VQIHVFGNFLEPPGDTWMLTKFLGFWMKGLAEMI